MKSKQWDVEEWMNPSALPEDLGPLYRQVFDHLDGLEVPTDMTDRIMAGLETENVLPVNAVSDSAPSENPFSVVRGQGLKPTGRGNVIFARFGRYAASIAACFVFAVGLFAVSNPAGQQIIGIGSEGGASVTSEMPVQAEADSTSANRRGDYLRVPEYNNAGSNGENTEQEAAVSVPDQQEESSGTRITASVPTRSENGTAETGTSTANEKKTTEAAGNKSGSEEPALNNASGNTTVSSTPASSAGTGNSGYNDSVQSNLQTDTGVDSSDPSVLKNSEQAGREEETRTENPSANNPETTETVPQDTGTRRSLILDGSHSIRKLSGVEELPDVMGYQPALPESLPEGWTVSSVEVIWGMTAQILYSDGENSVLYRTSANASVVSSDSGSYAFSKESGIYRLEGDAEDRVRLITWSSGNDSYSMAFDGAVSKESALKWAERVVSTDTEK